VKWEYCTVETFVTDWSGFDGPRGITLRGPGKQDFDDIDHALKQMGLEGWECFHIETTGGQISFSRTTIRFKRVMVE